MSTQKAAVYNKFLGLENTINWDIKTPYPGRGKVPIPEWMSFLTKDVGIELTECCSTHHHRYPINRDGVQGEVRDIPEES